MKLRMYSSWISGWLVLEFICNGDPPSLVKETTLGLGPWARFL
ncbi:MAG TPA: hypothetical protein PK156_23665 [Polyangium sp.]|nr:hypothetical protein [Polyangium sp.]